MRIAIASGKGGTGKTTLSVSLSLDLAKTLNRSVVLYDCDVEEPNSHLFLSLNNAFEKEGNVDSSSFDESHCTGCEKCVEACRFNAIAVVNKKPIFFPELCHGCGGCILACPEKVISDMKRPIGQVITGNSEKDANVTLRYGLLNIGEAMAPPLIKEVLDYSVEDAIEIIDSPPGTSCPMVNAVESSDFAILISESTPFGLNDLKIAVETVRLLKIPFGVVINRWGAGDSRVEEYCKKESIDILTRIPDSLEVAKLYSSGETAWMKVDSFTDAVHTLSNTIVSRYLTRKTM